MTADQQITETDEVVLTLLSLLIGTTIVAEPDRRKGMNDALAYVRDGFKDAGKIKAAALTEAIRTRSTDMQSNPALVNLLRMASQGTS